MTSKPITFECSNSDCTEKNELTEAQLAAAGFVPAERFEALRRDAVKLAQWLHGCEQGVPFACCVTASRILAEPALQDPTPWQGEAIRLAEANAALEKCREMFTATRLRVAERLGVDGGCGWNTIEGQATELRSRAETAERLLAKEARLVEQVDTAIGIVWRRLMGCLGAEAPDGPAEWRLTEAAIEALKAERDKARARELAEAEAYQQARVDQMKAEEQRDEARRQLKQSEEAIDSYRGQRDRFSQDASRYRDERDEARAEGCEIVMRQRDEINKARARVAELEALESFQLGARVSCQLGHYVGFGVVAARGMRERYSVKLNSPWRGEDSFWLSACDIALTSQEEPQEHIPQVAQASAEPGPDYVTRAELAKIARAASHRGYLRDDGMNALHALAEAAEKLEGKGG